MQDADHTGWMPRFVLLLVLLVLAGCGSDAVKPLARIPRPSPAPPGSPLDSLPPKDNAIPAFRQQQYEQWLRAEIARTRKSPTVEASLRVAQLTGHISPGLEASLRKDWANANTTVAKLTGVRHDELAYVIATIRTLAAAHMLTVDRLRPTFLILRTNTHFWATAPMPAAGFRTSPDADPAVFQYYPGHGLQLQPLASWGRANAIAGACLAALRSHTKRDRCRPGAMAKSLDRLSALGAQRSGYLAFEYYFAYGTGSPPWVSGMTQATAIQALSRGYRAMGKERWRRAALSALGAFEKGPPNGISVRAPGGHHYLLYSFAPGHLVFNGGLQAVIGLRDAAALLHSKRAEKLFATGERATRREVAEYDTGAWSLYSEHGAEATLNYHSLIAGFLANLCDRVHRRVYCSAGKRFKRYEHEPTKIDLTPLHKVRWDRTSTIRFSISKISTVKVRIWGTRGMSLSRDLKVSRGVQTLSWRPPGRGRYTLRITAQGPSGPLGVEQRAIRVTLPKPKPKKKKKVEPRSRKRERDRGSDAASGRKP
ncbi:D-glucuronyl C5-epimerase family protein [Solirubrobacter ginsenosidimutans]|uniref:D-glucuronyl C5-epimerase family protein n=1 Tax=Solirubrobacter ginsenosidimutans TaxID=490573 RepID=A0A9X3S2D6_9ACTN|nr:D-glucuronyl C5-epimerase family protein [Solirubrobacter ginsenosidimutans]MDA0163424.1 D-glucuronyl C5-epimerase family protein [Solirubrobacter ginsenosidimutans]